MGSITSTSVVSLGSGYAANDVIRVLQGANNTATIVIITVSGGVPVTYNLPEQSFNGLPNRTQRGCGYTVENNVPTQMSGSGGSGFVINILTVGPNSDATHGVVDSFSTDPPGSGGSGYAVGDTGTFVQGTNNSGCYRVAAAAGGVVISAALDGGDGYAIGIATTVAHTGGGSGFILDINDFFQCDFIPTPPPPTPTANPGNFVFGG